LKWKRKKWRAPRIWDDTPLARELMKLFIEVLIVLLVTIELAMRQMA